MKFLCIDYGAKKIGLAVSDDSGSIAFPKGIIKNDKNAIDRISDIAKHDNISNIVVGESRDFSGEPNPIMSEAKRFSANIENKSKAHIHWEKEFLTTVEARKSVSGKSKVQSNRARLVAVPEQKEVDDSAAALILQRFLDKRKK